MCASSLYYSSNCQALGQFSALLVHTIWMTILCPPYFSFPTPQDSNNMTIRASMFFYR